MKVGIIGLGSMGKRRIRNLQALGSKDILGFDSRDDRRQEAATRYGIKVVSDLKDLESAEAIIISTPPAHHEEFIDWSIQRGKPCFVELSILLQNLPRIAREAKAKGLLVAPSCTFLFHPAIEIIQKLLGSGEYGKVTDFVYHSGNYLPDWHPWETVGSFFVSDPETSGCRELLAFELNWISKIFGPPSRLQVAGKKALGFGLETNDTCGVHVQFPEFLGLLLVDVVSRFMTRSLTLNLEKGQVRWAWEKNEVQLFNASTKSWTTLPYSLGKSEAGYNENLSESVYVDELGAFLKAVQGQGTFPSTLEEDIQYLQLLEQKDAKAELTGSL